MPYLIDTHCHLHFPSYTPDQRDAALMKLREKQIQAITVGTSITTSRNAVAFAEEHDGIFAAIGHHPEHLTSGYHDESEGDANDVFDIRDFEELAKHPKVVAIGETGLDFFRIDEGRDIAEAKNTQEDAFRKHIDLAMRCEKPIVIHSRDAFPQLTQVIAEYPGIKGVVHCFTGTWEDAKPLIDLGLYLAFGGIITFPPKKTQNPEASVWRVIERMPMEQILVETDAPWLAPVPHRGQQNEPAYVEFVAQKIAELRGISIDIVAKSTTENAQRLFGI